MFLCGDLAVGPDSCWWLIKSLRYYAIVVVDHHGVSARLRISKEAVLTSYAGSLDPGNCG